MRSEALNDLPVGVSKQDTQNLLQSDRYADSVYITECNKPVCVYIPQVQSLYEKLSTAINLAFKPQSNNKKQCKHKQ